MILSELNKLLVNIASSNYLVNDAFVGDVYTINGKENRFGCFVATPMTANKVTVGTIRYNYVLYYIDRLTKDESNIDYVQSDAVSVLKGILNFIDEQGIEVEDGYEFTLFRQKFSDWCAGAYVSVNIMVPDYECGEGDFNTEGIDLRPLVTDRNGIYEAGTNGGFSRVTINVPQVGATEAWVDNEIDLKLEGYASQEWVNEQGFLTEHQDLSSYATKEYVDDGLDTLREEIPSLEGYATKNWVQNQGFLTGIPSTYATKNYVNSQGFLKEADLTDYALKSYVDNLDFITEDDLTGYATQTWVQNQGFLTGVPSSYATKTFVNNQGFLKEDDLSEYALKSYVDNLDFLTEDDLTGYATQTWVNNQGFLTSVPSTYATQAWVQNQDYISSGDIDDMATKTWVRQQGFLIDDDIADLASRSWVGLQGFITEDDLCGYATEEWVNQQGFLTEDDLCGYATEEWTRNWVDNQGFLKQCDLDPYATKNWIENQGYASIDDIDEIIDDRIDHAFEDLRIWVDGEIDLKLTGYATETWVTNQISGLASETWVTNQISGLASETWVTNQISSSLTGYATQTWVQNQGYLVSSDISGKLDSSLIWSGPIDDWERLTPEQQCSYLIALIYD